MSDHDEQRDANTFTTDDTSDSNTSNNNSPTPEDLDKMPLGDEPPAKNPLPKKSFADNFLRGCGYVLLASAIIVMLLFGACYIMILSYH